jgi:hypothetical protein
MTRSTGKGKPQADGTKIKNLSAARQLVEFLGACQAQEAEQPGFMPETLRAAFGVLGVAAALPNAQEQPLELPLGRWYMHHPAELCTVLSKFVPSIRGEPGSEKAGQMLKRDTICNRVERLQSVIQRQIRSAVDSGEAQFSHNFDTI